MIAATLKSLLARKLRLTLAGLAVVLGVMSVSGAFAVTDSLSRSFTTLFAEVFADLDVEVTGQQNVAEGVNGGEAEPEPVPAALVERIAAVPGVKTATGEVFADGARVIGKDGKVIPSQGPPRFGVAWHGEDGVVELRQGRGPSAADEIAVNAGLAKQAGFHVGDRIGVLTREPKHTFTLVGVFGYSGNRDTFGGETRVAFTPEAAQRLMLGTTGVVTAVDVIAEDGVSPEALRDRIASAVGDAYTVRTGDEVADAQATGIASFLGVLRNVLLGFAGVSLLVGSFLILNTFSILVAQRTGELALFRALGARRRQLIGAVLIEAVAVGVIASTLGLFAGVGLGALLDRLMEAQTNARLPGSGVSLPLAAVVASYAVGLLVTVLAAVVPAVRAARTAPVEAMRARESDTAERALTGLTVWGGVVTAAGATAILGALGDRLGDGRVPALIGGVAAVFVGVALVAPLVTRPAVNLLGRVFSWSVPGLLGQRNSARNPRRTAITASALMIGMALVTGVGVLTASLKASVAESVEQDLDAQLVIGGDFAGRSLPTYDPAVLDEVRRIPGVQRAVAVRVDAAQVAGGATEVAGGDLAAMAGVLRLTATDGSLRMLKPGEIAVDSTFARDRGLVAGDRVEIATMRGGRHVYTVAAVLAPSRLLPGPVLSESDAAAGFRTAQAAYGYIALRPGTDSAAVQRKVAALLADNPEVTVQDQTGFVAQRTAQIDLLSVMLYGLLALALLIAVLGIVNTLALSVLERTRELGLVRAVGMRRGQVAGMVAVESVVISLFGALLGMLVGAGVGAAVVGVFADDIPVLSIPWLTMGVFVGIAAVGGVVAALLPAVRAGRVDVLRAIAYE